MPNPETVDYVYLERVCRRELRLHDFKPREFCVLSLILDHSYAIGRAEAFFQTQDQIAALTCIRKSHMSTVLGKLRVNNVINVHRGIGRYSLNSDSNSWKVSPLFDDSQRRAVDRLESMLRQLNATPVEQLHLLEPLPDLDALIYEEARILVSSTPSPGVPRAINHGVSSLNRDGATSDISDEPPASGRRGDQGASPADVPPGDPFDSERLGRLIAASLDLKVVDDGSQFGNSVPNSGTPLIRTINSEANASRLKEPYKPAVPISGTKRRRTELEAELLEALAMVTSPEEIKQNGGWWTLQIRRNASLVREAISDLRLRQMDRNLKPVRKPVGWLRSHYERLVRHHTQNS